MLERLKDIAELMRTHQALCAAMPGADRPSDIMHVRGATWGEAAELLEELIAQGVTE